MSGDVFKQLRAANTAAHKARTDTPGRPAGDKAQADAAPGGATGHIQGEGYVGRDGQWYSEDHHAYPADQW